MQEAKSVKTVKYELLNKQKYKIINRKIKISSYEYDVIANRVQNNM